MSKPSPVLLRDIRSRLGITQRSLAQKLGVTTRTVTRWELGQTEMPNSAVPRALALLRARDPAAADRIGIEAGLPGVIAQEEARRVALDHAVYAAADGLDVSPRRAREVLATFLTHVVAAGMGAGPPAAARSREAASTDRVGGQPRAGAKRRARRRGASPNLPDIEEVPLRRAID